ncbi:hypothetical protein BFJ66_g5546 [Fusarium oxysporum f. sp. cepae]|uniref:Methyltransferase domain-containing protein n=1 Tax=Fusarium oxysporum f. sp. cepae TaxID=396571 RepID=A0A3L6NF65_FUSOX|nr:hypothetical protein BFJ65_g10121 [Fusarium oxysporum f. sp. cepae]RKK51341.1 hypothetical protein BFJ67_g6090 [Fusarium oxysporum f. sp. cepae]RKK52578.1 hypothetical protein BFJ66_g5546 [Fusarium oxysporum f. sp. cepae]
MAPLVPRFHLFEIDDQTWFPAFLRARVQDGLTRAWLSNTPLQSQSPASLSAQVLIKQLNTSLPDYTYIDFCAGGGGPTPSIARTVNAHLQSQESDPVRFILTDLHPNVEAWEQVAQKNPLLTYERNSVDAASAPEYLVKREDGTKPFRLFNLAFHHFDDDLAKDILRDTVETSEGLAIFELQDRSFASVLAVTFLGIGAFFSAPFFAFKWRSPATLIFSCLIPILPFVLMFDGYISALRTRTPEEVEALLRSCGADTSKWEVRSGSEMHLWPCGYVNWVICRPVRKG